MAASGRSLRSLGERITACRCCPRLVHWREETARQKRRAYLNDTYWARPVPGFGDPAARVAAVGLAPAAHGANRTGRMFTGDRSGEWLYRALHRAGLATAPVSRGPGDGLRLRAAYVTAAVRCAPPANRPTPEERDACLPYLATELALLDRIRVVVALGGFAWDGILRALGQPVGAARPKFAHGAMVPLGDGRLLLGCYHPSQQNTFTGRLTEAMLDDVFRRAVAEAERP